MNKYVTMFLIFVMLLVSATAVMADGEDTASTTLNWITARRGIRQNEISGGFYQIGDLDMDIWIPDLMTARDDIPEDSFYVFTDKDESVFAKVHRVDIDGDTSLQGLEKLVTDLGFVSDGFYWINGYNVLICESKEEDTLSVLIPFEDETLEFLFWPMSNPDYYSLTSLILSTIQPHRLTVRDVALMIDADLNGYWGPNKEVRYVDDPDNLSITIFQWEDGMTSETIKNVNNWDAVRDDMIKNYNMYVDVLDEFSMNDAVLLTQKYISPEEDLSFLTISGGEIEYDAGDYLGQN